MVPPVSRTGLTAPLRRAKPLLEHAKINQPHTKRASQTKSIRTLINDGPVVIYRAGENFSEMPGDRYSVDENASNTEPAKLLAVFVVDTDEKELTTPYEE